MALENGFWAEPNGLVKEAVGEVKGFTSSAEEVANGLIDCCVGAIETGGVMRICVGTFRNGFPELEKNRNEPANPANTITKNKVTIMKGNFLWGEETEEIDGGGIFIGGGAIGGGRFDGGSGVGGIAGGGFGGVTGVFCTGGTEVVGVTGG